MLRSIAKRSTFGIYLESVITRHVDFVCYLNLQFSQVSDNLDSSEFVGKKLCLKNIMSQMWQIENIEATYAAK